MPRPKQDIMSFVEKTMGCWRWTGGFTNGYGRYEISRGVAITAHRGVYKLYRGRISDGLHIDHLCENKWCVNPDHLEAVPLAENTRRANERREWRRRITRFLETGKWESTAAARCREKRAA